MATRGTIRLTNLQRGQIQAARIMARAKRTRASYPTKVNPNKNEHWTGLSRLERTTDSNLGRTGGNAPMPRYVTSRRDYDGREQVERTHAQRYRDLRAAFNVT